ncbi:SusC/RagA family TonB-linked outer membrane protein [Dysgonomonas sp. ZJ279]|uniref:SusC/RagA family TonB-linked outer membrane protein n=1 Tax=Dysgonomonas sp. ZJ279 TaxID=2709796 RepID=UPI0013EBED5C|nr:TonB-dependent receptor [Dysgonomonas sp. ZJ279]
MEKKFKSKKTTRFILFLLFGLFLTSNAFAQQQSLKGIVKDETGEPVIGASVVVKGTTNGTRTDIDGNYSLSGISKGATIVVSYIGYTSQEIAYTGQKELNIILLEDTKLLDEVVVIGYGQVRKGDATGSISSIKADTKVRGFAPNAQDMLMGKVAGVNIINEGGSPSAGATIRIRGGSSLSASNDPLIIIDGVFLDNKGMGGVGNILSTVNPTDIESFTVLKDASATAIYGSRASNGVIIITTKKGVTGKVKVTYDGNFSISTPKNQIDVLTGDGYRAFIDNAFSGNSNFEEMKSKLGSDNTNWQDKIFRTTINTEHNLSALGSVKNVPYRVSFGYTNLQGILKTSEMERYTGSISLSPTLFNDHLKVNLNGRGMYIHNRFANQGAIGAAISMDPTQSVYDENSPFGGFFTWMSGAVPNQVATINPVSMLEMTQDKSNVYNFIGNAQFDYKLHFLPDLHFNLNLGMDYSKSEGTKYIPENAPSDYIYGGLDSSWDQKRRNTTFDLYSQYFHKLDFLDSKFDVMGGYSWQHYWRSDSNIGHRISKFDAAGNPLLVSFNDTATEHYIISFFGRFNYSVKDKYLMTFTLRQDGSSRFHKNNRWALFPSLALAWRMIDEDFLKDSNVISNMKFRLGWGITGQQDINQGDYAYMGTYEQSSGNEANYLRGYTDGQGNWVSLLRPAAYNPDLKWESTTTYNVGLDYGFLKNRIEGSIDIYHRKTNDLINEETRVAAGTNFRERIVTNVGSLKNSGVELSLNGTPIVTKDLAWEIGGNVAYNKNEITKLNLGNVDTPIPNSGVKVFKTGESAQSFFVYEQIYDEQGKPIEGFYKDRNNDGLINQDDLFVYQKSTPDWTFGLNTKLTWKAWDVAIAGHGSLGNFNYNQIAATGAALSSASVFANEFLVNRPLSAFDTNFQTGQNSSNYYVQNASFFRVDNIVLGWSFMRSKQLPFGGRIYGAVQNPFIFTKYKGLDPEVYGGIDGNIYPRPLTILFGVNLNF